jgi:hypothetical protein
MLEAEVIAASILLGVMVLLFVGSIACQLVGYRFGVRWRARTEWSGEGSAAVEASLFALLGLLIAFMISGGETRLNARRDLIVREANAIGTAYLRLELLPEESRPLLRDEMRRYVDARIAFYSKLLKLKEARVEQRRAADLQDQIWKDAVAATAEVPDVRAAVLVLPAVNEMIDVTTARAAALRTHVPMAIFVLLVLLSLACAFFAGVGMSKHRAPSRMHVIAFAAMLALTAYVLINLELPRVGFVRLGPIDALLTNVRAGMN